MLANVKYERVSGSASASTTINESNFDSVDGLKFYLHTEGPTLYRDYCHLRAENYDGTDPVEQNTLLSNDESFNVYVDGVMIMSGSIIV